MGARVTDIFVSYKSEDKEAVRRLVDRLVEAGFSVWWDSQLPGAQNWRENIQQALDAAKCVVVVWTRGSVGAEGNFVRDEASQASKRGILAPVLFERGVRIPLGFGELQAVDLANWKGNPRDPFFLDLLDVCRAKIEGRIPPPPRGPALRSIAEGLGALILLPAAIALATFCQQAFQLGTFLAKVFEGWLINFRTVWARLLDATPIGTPAYINDGFRDILTLWITLAGAIFILPLIPGAKLRDGTTVEALERIRLHRTSARIAALGLILCAAAFLSAPFATAFSELRTSWLLSAGGEEARTWLRTNGLWLAFALGVASFGLLFYSYFIAGERLAAIELSEREKQDVQIGSISL
jgi:hypothetical protein